VFHLFNDAVCYSEETSIGLKLHRLMDLNAGCFAGDNPDPSVQHSFLIVATGKSFVVVGADATTKAEWLAAFDSVLADIRKHTKDASASAVGGGGGSAAGSAVAAAAQQSQPSLAPIWAGNHSAAECSLCRAEFTFFRRRHHCRACGALCCGDCSEHERLLRHIDARDPVRVCDKCAPGIPE
jgi:FYVE/RhoGEF/PH domain-containing protein 5/6